jgi:hypothetical protein
MPENTNLILLASYAGSLFSFGRNAKSGTVLAALQLAPYGAFQPNPSDPQTG